MDGSVALLQRAENTHLIGKAHEDRFFDIMSRIDRTFPGWYYGVRRGTPKEDRQGIDFIAELDVLEVFLQIKSSKRGREEHERQQRKYRRTEAYNIPVIIVCDRLSDDIVRTQTLRILFNDRERFFREARR